MPFSSINSAKNSQQAGFSLVELMIVVAIIGVLAALAVPRYQTFQAKAKQTEAKNNLSQIYTLQQSYFGDNDTFGSLSTIGFSLASGSNGAAAGATGSINSNRYAYSAVFSTSSFTATASAAAGRIASCAGIDTWTIDQNKALTNTVVGLTGC